jgi:hypothetical protein
MESQKYTLNAEDLKKIAMAMVYSGSAAAIAVLAAALEQVDMPTMYLALVPIINAMLYTAVKFLQGKASV